MEVDTSVAAAEPSVQKVAFVLGAAVRDCYKCRILSLVIWARRLVPASSGTDMEIYNWDGQTRKA
jgi:hypothetical protein